MPLIGLLLIQAGENNISEKGEQMKTEKNMKTYVVAEPDNVEEWKAENLDSLAWKIRGVFEDKIKASAEAGGFEGRTLKTKTTITIYESQTHFAEGYELAELIVTSDAKGEVMVQRV